jgi:hypothetical protein
MVRERFISRVTLHCQCKPCGYLDSAFQEKHLNTCENIPHLLVSKGDNKGGEKVTKGKIIEVQRQGGNTSLK